MLILTKINAILCILLFILERRRHKTYLNITLYSTSKHGKSSRKCEIFIEFLGSVDDYCTPKNSSCFPDTNAEYYVPEDTVIGSNLDYLTNPGWQMVCPNLTLQYNSISGECIFIAY